MKSLLDPFKFFFFFPRRVCSYKFTCTLSEFRLRIYLNNFARISFSYPDCLTKLRESMAYPLITQKGNGQVGFSPFTICCQRERGSWLLKTVWGECYKFFRHSEVADGIGEIPTTNTPSMIFVVPSLTTIHKYPQT